MYVVRPTKVPTWEPDFSFSFSFFVVGSSLFECRLLLSMSEWFNGLFVLLHALCIDVYMCVMRMYTYCIVHIRHLFTQMQNGKLRREIFVFGSSCAALCLVFDTLHLCVPIEITIDKQKRQKNECQMSHNFMENYVIFAVSSLNWLIICAHLNAVQFMFSGWLKFQSYAMTF